MTGKRPRNQSSHRKKLHRTPKRREKMLQRRATTAARVHARMAVRRTVKKVAVNRTAESQGLAQTGDQFIQSRTMGRSLSGRIAGFVSKLFRRER